MAYEALYRRYRPSRFADAFFGQEHVVAALRNAIEGDRVGHAYMFSGPRGTGKTTSARILAKALNCTNLQGGEPCDECESCLAFRAGGSYDLHELDAASNNGVDAMRDLIGKVALGSPGRTKVYILDEVHMLSSGAENALLKTLEEPPPHVVFVLCTTEPNKVVPTIRSRTQHLEFSLLSASQVGELIDYVVGDAGLEITTEDRAYVIRSGGGSARDTLSALDQVVAAGGAPQGGEHLDALFQALIDRDGGAALGAIEGALTAGRDAATIATSLLHELRTVFLATMRADTSHLPEAEAARASERAASLSPARVTRAIEVIGTSVIEMRQAPDPRVDLEVALMRLTRVDLDTDPAALIERLEAIERQLGGGAPISVAPTASPAPAAASSPGQVAPEQPAPAQQPAARQHAPPQAPEPAPQQAPPQQHDPPPQQQAAPSEGRRGADIARAELARQGITTPGAAAKPAASTKSLSPDQAAAPASTGKTLADVRRERQAAAQQTAAPAEDAAAVEAAAAARRERQAAAQTPTETPADPAQAPPASQATDQTPPQQTSPQQAAPSAPAPSEPAASEPAPAEPARPAFANLEQEPTPTARPHAEPAPSEPAASEPAASEPGPSQALQEDPVSNAPAPEPSAPQPPAPESPAPAGSLPTLGELEAAWQSLLESTSGKVRSRFSAGHFMETSADTVMFGLPNPVHRDRCEEIRSEVDDALAATFGRPIPLKLVVDETDPEPDFFTPPPSGGAVAVDEIDDGTREEDTVDIHSLVDATDDIPSAADRVMSTFDGSTLLEDPQSQPPDY